MSDSFSKQSERLEKMERKSGTEARCAEESGAKTVVQWIADDGAKTWIAD
jgi:hypothetical protein